MHDFIEMTLSSALSNSLVASLLAVPAWAASRWSKPTVAHALWILVFVKLVTPPLIDVTLPLPDALASLASRPSAAEDAPTKPERKPQACAAVRGAIAHDENDLAGDADPRFVGATFLEASESARPNDETEMLRPEVVAGGPGLDAALSSSPLPHDGTSLNPMPGDELLPASTQPDNGDRPEPRPFGPFEVAQVDASEESLASTDGPRDRIREATSSPTAEAPIDAPTVLAAVVAPDGDRWFASIDAAPSALAIVWLSGTAVWFLLAAIRIRRFRRALRHATPATPPLQAEVADLAARIGLRRVPDVSIVPGQVSPLVCTPLGRAVLVLPRELLARFSPAQRAAVVAHELAHLRRLDHWTRWLEMLAVGCYWWLPTVWFARRRLHQAEEACCDAWVVWLLPDRSRDYAQALLETIDFLTPTPAAPLLASGFGRASSLKGRFEMILTQRASRRMSWPARLAVAAVGLLVLPWSLTTLSAEDETAPPAATDNEEVPADVDETAIEPLADDATPESITDGNAESRPAIFDDALPEDVPNLPDDAAPPEGAKPLLSPLSPPAENQTPPRARRPFPRRRDPNATDAPRARSAAGLNDPRRSPLFDNDTGGDASFADTTSNDDQVLRRLDRLEATTAELLALVKQLRADRPVVGTAESVPGNVAGRFTNRTTSNAFAVPLTHADRKLHVNVNGPKIIAVDAKSGKVLWSTDASGNVTAIQTTGGKLQAMTADGTTLLIDVETGKINSSVKRGISKTTSRRSTPNAEINPNYRHAAAVASQIADSDAVRAAKQAEREALVVHAKKVADIELEMIRAERQLAEKRAELQHRVRQLDVKRERLLRKLGGVPNDEARSVEREELLDRIDNAEDELIAMQREADVFETALEFKVRELQIQRDERLRAMDAQRRDPQREQWPTKDGGNPNARR